MQTVRVDARRVESGWSFSFDPETAEWAEDESRTRFVAHVAPSSRVGSVVHDMDAMANWDSLCALSWDFWVNTIVQLGSLRRDVVLRQVNRIIVRNADDPEKKQQFVVPVQDDPELRMMSTMMLSSWQRRGGDAVWDCLTPFGKVSVVRDEQDRVRIISDMPIFQEMGVRVYDTVMRAIKTADDLMMGGCLDLLTSLHDDLSGIFQEHVRLVRNQRAEELAAQSMGKVPQASAAVEDKSLPETKGEMDDE